MKGLQEMQNNSGTRCGFRSKLDRCISISISCIALAFLGYILLRYRAFSYMLKEDVPETTGFFLMVFLHLFVFALFRLSRDSISRQKLPIQLLYVLCFAAVPRLFLLFLLPYTETGDFSNFVMFGRLFLQGRYTELAPNFSSLPDFMGLSWLTSLTMRVFGDTTGGLRLANCLYSIGSCIMIFLIGRRYNPRAGLLAAELYAFYPASILAAETVGNPVLSAFFLLLSVYLILLAASATTRLCFLYATLSGCVMLLSQYMHPSSLTTILAISFFLFPLVMQWIRQPKRLLRVVCLYICFFIGLVGLRGVCNLYFRSLGLISDATGKQSDYYIVKLVMGLNPETNGNYSAEDIAWCDAQSPETRNQAALARIRQRLPTLRDMLKMVDTKIMYTWMARDTYYSMFFGGLSNQIAAAETQGSPSEALETMKVARTVFARGFILMDFFYVALLYLAAFVGILLRNRTTRESDLFIWIFLGFAGIFIFIESQSRYRYPAMPFLCLLAGIGIHETAAVLLRKKGTQDHNAVGAEILPSSATDD